MPSKKKKSAAAPQTRRNEKERIIQYAALAAMIVAVLAAAYPYLIKPLAQKLTAPEPSAAAPADLSGALPAGVCKEFAAVPAAAQYAEQPPMKIDKNKRYFANFKMANGGEFAVQLYADKAPLTVNNFVFLACKGFYNGVTFHRVIDGFMAQGGDPTGTGAGGPGYQFADEQNGLVFDRAGLLAMANAGPNTNGSQFFITYAPTEWLNGKHTIFGEVTEGMDVVNGLKRGDPNTPGFVGDAIESVTILEK